MGCLSRFRGVGGGNFRCHVIAIRPLLAALKNKRKKMSNLKVYEILQTIEGKEFDNILVLGIKGGLVHMSSSIGLTAEMINQIKELSKNISEISKFEPVSIGVLQTSSLSTEQVTSLSVEQAVCSQDRRAHV